MSVAALESPDPSTLLDAVPTRNTAVRAERRGPSLVLWVPVRRPWWTRGPLEWLLPWRKERGFALDALGEEVWSACDGEQRLEGIVEAFSARHRLRFHEGRVAVLSFLRSLVERRLVALVWDARIATGQPVGEGPS